MKMFLLGVALCFLLHPICAAAQTPEEYAGELLLCVSANGEDDSESYLDGIASVADAVVVRVYDALSDKNQGPILLLIGSDTNDSDKMMKLLEDDARVISMSENRKVRAINRII
jgi:hypothetical protein